MLEYHSRPMPETKELALQIVDVISLRREIRLAYVGLKDMCFEIAEVEHSNSAGHRSQDNNNNHSPFVDDADHSNGNSEGDEQTDDDDDEDDDDNDLFVDGEDDFAEEASDDAQSEADSFIAEAANRPLPRLRLREILYYDDKVELFRARHGKL
jgi:cobalamin biosynthesis protein CobT